MFECIYTHFILLLDLLGAVNIKTLSVLGETYKCKCHILRLGSPRWEEISISWLCRKCCVINTFWKSTGHRLGPYYLSLTSPNFIRHSYLSNFSRHFNTSLYIYIFLLRLIRKINDATHLTELKTQGTQLGDKQHMLLLQKIDLCCQNMDKNTLTNILKMINPQEPIALAIDATTTKMFLGCIRNLT